MRRRLSSNLVATKLISRTENTEADCKCRHMDFLGEPVSLRYKGSSKTQSTCGSVCSLLVVLIILAYLANSVTMVVFGAPGIISQSTLLRSQDQPDQSNKLLEV